MKSLCGYYGFTHCNALPHDTGLLHAPWSSKLLHVFTEITLSTVLSPPARLTLSTHTGRTLHLHTRESQLESHWNHIGFIQAAQV